MCEEHHRPPVYPVITLYAVITLCQIGVLNLQLLLYIWMRSQPAVDVTVQISMIAEYIALLVLLQKQTIQYCSQHIDFCRCCCIKPLGSVNTKLKHNTYGIKERIPMFCCKWMFMFSLCEHEDIIVWIFYAWLTISAKLFSYYVCVAHIQNNAFLYFCDIIQRMHMTAFVCWRRQKIYVDLHLTQVHIHKIFYFIFFIQCMDFCELPAVLVLAVLKYEKTASCGIT